MSDESSGYHPYAVGGYNDRMENVDSNEIFLDMVWIPFKKLASARSHFALTSVTQDAIAPPSSVRQL